MKIILTAKKDGIPYIDVEGYYHEVYEGYEVHIDDAESLHTDEEDGELVAVILYPLEEGEVSQSQNMYPLSDWDVAVL